MFKNGTLEEDSETEEDTEAEEKRVLKKVEQESQTYASTGYNMNYGQNNYGQQNYGNRGFGQGRQQIPGQNELNRRLKPEEEDEKLEKEIDDPDVSLFKKVNFSMPHPVFDMFSFQWLATKINPYVATKGQIKYAFCHDMFIRVSLHMVHPVFVHKSLFFLFFFFYSTRIIQSIFIPIIFSLHLNPLSGL